MKESVKKIGLFGGTFDPIHFGHLNLALELKEKTNLDEVWFIPARVNPFKIDLLPIDIDHRLKMISLAIQEVPFFFVKDIEKERTIPSYTIDTVKYFVRNELFPSASYQFFLLLGEDAVPGFFHWHQAGEIVTLVNLLIGSRTGSWNHNFDLYDEKVRKAVLEGLTPTHLMDISGTEIRYRLANEMYCGHLVNKDVLGYIYKNQLYKDL